MNTYKKYKNLALIFLVVLFIAFGLFSPINTAEAGKGFSFNPFTWGPTGGIPCSGWPWPTVGCSVDTSMPICSSAGPDDWRTTDTAGTQTVYVYGVYNTNAVYFLAWSEENGQDDLIWYESTQVDATTAKADINLASHPGVGPIYVHVYLYSNATQSWTICDSANGARIASCSGGASPTCASYGDQQTVNVNWPASGRTGEWWCDNHFGGNLGGTWDCISVSGGYCPCDAPLGSNVTCGRCSEAAPAVNGACSATHYNCSAGTLSTPSEDGSWWWWWCIGSNGGSNSEMCYEAKACVPNNCETNTCTGQTCWNGCATVSGTKVCVPAPTVTFSASPTSIPKGNSSTLTWTTASATSCWATNGWTGWKANAGGTETASPQATTTYTIECWNSIGTSSGQASATVTVTCNPNCNDSGDYCQGTPYSGNCGQTCTGTIPTACGGWEACDKGCGGGTQTKSCVCPNGTETRICNSQPCPPGYREVTPW